MRQNPDVFIPVLTFYEPCFAAGQVQACVLEQGRYLIRFNPAIGQLLDAFGYNAAIVIHKLILHADIAALRSMVCRVTN